MTLAGQVAFIHRAAAIQQNDHYTLRLRTAA